MRLKSIPSAAIQRACPALVILLSLLALGSSAVYHAVPVTADPAQGAVLKQSPGRVSISYGLELLSGHSTQLHVLDASGAQVDAGNGAVDLSDPAHSRLVVGMPATLPAGTYTVTWLAVTAGDGHRGHMTRGDYTFSIAAPGAQSAQATTDPNYNWQFVGVDPTVDHADPPPEAPNPPAGNTMIGFYAAMAALVVILPVGVVAGLWLISRRRRQSEAREES